MLTNAQLNYLHYKEKGICVQCGQWDASPGKVRCEVCLLKEAEEANKLYQSMSEDEKKELRRKQYESIKKLREERRRKGLCIECGKPICNKSKIRCLEHYLKARKRYKRKRDGIPRSEWSQYGLCTRCGKKAIEGKGLCQKCYDKDCLGESKYLASDEIRKSWGQQNKLIFRK